LSEKALSDEDEPHDFSVPESSLKKPVKSIVNTFEPEDESLYEIVPMSLYKYQPLDSHKDNDCSNSKNFNNMEVFKSKREPHQRESYQRERHQREPYHRKQFKENFKKQYTNEKDFLRKLDEEADESFKNSRRESDFTSKNVIHP